MPELQKVLDGVAHPLHLVGRDRRVVAHERGIGHGHRHSRGQGQVLTPGAPRLNHDQAINRLVRQPQHGGAHILGGRALHLHHGDGVPGIPGRREHALGGQRLTGALNVLSDHPDRARRPPTQRLSGEIGRVPQLLHRTQHLVPGAGTHVRGAAGDPGDRLSRHACQPGDVRDRRDAGPAPPRTSRLTHGHEATKRLESTRETAYVNDIVKANPSSPASNIIAVNAVILMHVLQHDYHVNVDITDSPSRPSRSRRRPPQ